MSLSQVLGQGKRRAGLRSLLSEAGVHRPASPQDPLRQARSPAWESDSFGAVSVAQRVDKRGRTWLNLHSRREGERALRFGWSKAQGRWSLGRVPPIELVEEARDHGWTQFPVPSPQQVNIEGARARKSKAKAKKKPARPQVKRVQNNAGFEPGDVLYSSWGYNQTNVNFYQVLSVTKATVEICPISKRVERQSRGANYVAPVIGECTGSPMKKRTTEGSDMIKAPYGRAWRWDGKPKYQTALGWGH